ncbi:MAG TPA: ribose-phosphate diphosphokinase, partial [Armatimonadota bacterium]
EGKRVVIVDDIVDTAGSLVAGAQALMEHGAREIYACATHGVLSGPAIQRLMNSPIKKLVVTDTIPVPAEKQVEKLEVLSVAPMLAEGIRRIHSDQSLSTLFDRFWVQDSR